ncbi:hypothetical protein K438DRAFT_2013218 [Mycena galopus ATCC 62051]|nr:hypothetical protein K438DRAFT_2013218 [Mycena galopus ATCC 62051]
MSLMRHTTPNHNVKLEDQSGSIVVQESTISDVKASRKRARCGSTTSMVTAEARTASLRRVKEEDFSDLTDIRNADVLSTSHTHTNADYERLQELLDESYRTREGVIEQNASLVAELRTTRGELHKLRAFTEFASNKLYEQARLRFRRIDSDTASEDELEDSRSEEDM